MSRAASAFVARSKASPHSARVVPFSLALCRTEASTARRCIGTSQPHSSIRPANARHSAAHNQRLLSVLIRSYLLPWLIFTILLTAFQPAFFNPRGRLDDKPHLPFSQKQNERLIKKAPLRQN